MKVEEIEAKIKENKQKLTELHLKENEIVQEMNKIRTENNKLEIERVRMLLKTTVAPDKFYIEFGVDGYHTNLFKIYHVLNVVANGTSFSYSVMTFRIDDSNCSFNAEKGGYMRITQFQEMKVYEVSRKDLSDLIFEASELNIDHVYDELKVLKEKLGGNIIEVC